MYYNSNVQMYEKTLACTIFMYYECYMKCAVARQNFNSISMFNNSLTTVLLVLPTDVKMVPTLIKQFDCQ